MHTLLCVHLYKLTPVCAQFYKLTPDFFKAWMEILRRAPRSRLWLLAWSNPQHCFVCEPFGARAPKWEILWSAGSKPLCLFLFLRLFVCVLVCWGGGGLCMRAVVNRFIECGSLECAHLSEDVSLQWVLVSVCRGC